MISAATAVAFNFAGDITAGAGPIAKIAAHAAIGCGSAVLGGGKCGAGALSAAIGAATTVATRGMDFTTRLIAVTTMGGLASVAGGGKFGNGAVTAAFGYLFNEFGNSKQRGYPLSIDDVSVTRDADIFEREFRLEDPSENGGMVLQRMTMDLIPANGEPIHREWYEQFEMPKGLNYSTADSWALGTGDKEVTYNATATYYEGMTWNDLLQRGFRPGLVAGRPAGGVIYSGSAWSLGVNPGQVLSFPRVNSSNTVSDSWHWQR